MTSTLRSKNQPKPDKCGGCFTETVKLQVTHPDQHNADGALCPQCGRVYINGGGATLRLDVDGTFSDNKYARGITLEDIMESAEDERIVALATYLKEYDHIPEVDK